MNRVFLAPLLCALALPAHAVAEQQDQAAVSDPLEMQTITIVGGAPNIPSIGGSAFAIDELELERFGYDDINRVLNQVPGIYIREEDGLGLRPNIGLRGGSSDRSQKVTLLEDGVLFGPAPYSAPAAYYFPLTARMTGVEVFKGPSAISQGPQTIGGAVNLLSAPVPSQQQGFFEASGGSDGYRRVHGRVGGPLGDSGWLAEGIHAGHDGFKNLDGGDDTGFVKNELMLKGRRLLGAGILELRVAYADEVSQETYLGLTEADFRADPHRRYLASKLDRFEWDWNSVRADWQQDWLGGELIASAYNHRFSRAWRKFNNFSGIDVREVLENPETPANRIFFGVLTGAEDSNLTFDGDDLLIGTNDRDFRSSGLQGKLNWRLSGRGDHELEVGARLHGDRVERVHDEFAFEVVDAQLIESSRGRAITTDNTGRSVAVAAWVRDQWMLGSWTLTPGVRVERVDAEFTDRLASRASDNAYTVVLPGFGVHYALRPNLQLIAGIHEGFSPATVGPSQSLDPEEALNYEAGGRTQTAFGDFELIGFFNDYSNLTAICTFSVGCSDLDTQTNAGAVEVYGFEFAFKHRLKLGDAMGFPVALSYTQTQSEFQTAFTASDRQLGAVEPGFELPYLPEHRANARIGWDMANWSAGLSVSYQSRMRDSAGEGPIPNGTGSDSFTVLDLSGRWDFNAHFSVMARADNLLDREYIVSRRPFGARPGKPQSFQLGLRYAF